MIGRFKLAVAMALLLGAVFAFSSAQEAPLKVTILYDNTAARTECRADWGFSAFVEGTEKTLLFDVGTKGEILAHNVQATGTNLSEARAVVISHAHADHTGGLETALKGIPGIRVYLPGFPPATLTEMVTRNRATPVSMTQATTVCRNVSLTGTMGDQIKEQSLVISTPKGLVVITGCSHPGIVPILERAREVGKDKIYAVLGGFHLLQHSDPAVAEIVGRFRALGVEKVGASHCTGAKAIAAFRSAYGSDFIELGAGRVVRFD